MSYTEDINFIHKHLTDELTDAEDKQFDAWKESSMANQVLSDQIESIWDAAGNTTYISFDANSAFQNHLAKLKAEEAQDSTSVQPTESTITETPIKQIIPSDNTKIFKLNWVRALAAVFILAIAVILLFDKNDISKTDTNQLLTLSDGSKVWLYKGASFDQNAFSPNNRNVKLSGKAYFDIKPNADAPFKIVASGFDVQVLGTQFLINSDENTVAVKEGKVKVSNKKGNAILIANQKAVITDTKDLNVENIDFDDSSLWFNEDLKFNKVPFDKVVKDLSENYNVKFALPARNDWTSCTFTSGSLKGNSLDQVLVILKLTYDLEYTRAKDNTIVLSKVKCK